MWAATILTWSVTLFYFDTFGMNNRVCSHFGPTPVRPNGCGSSALAVEAVSQHGSCWHLRPPVVFFFLFFYCFILLLTNKIFFTFCKRKYPKSSDPWRIFLLYIIVQNSCISLLIIKRLLVFHDALLVNAQNLLYRELFVLFHLNPIVCLLIF